MQHGHYNIKYHRFVQDFKDHLKKVKNLDYDDLRVDVICRYDGDKDLTESATFYAFPDAIYDCVKVNGTPSSITVSAFNGKALLVKSLTRDFTPDFDLVAQSQQAALSGPNDAGALNGFYQQALSHQQQCFQYELALKEKDTEIRELTEKLEKECAKREKAESKLDKQQQANDKKETSKNYREMLLAGGSLLSGVAAGFAKDSKSSSFLKNMSKSLGSLSGFKLGDVDDEQTENETERDEEIEDVLEVIYEGLEQIKAENPQEYNDCCEIITILLYQPQGRNSLLKWLNKAKQQTTNSQNHEGQ